MISEKDKNLFENKGVLSAILTLALPSIFGQIILVIYNMADTFFVGLTNNNAMITAVTVCMPAFMFLSAISNLFGIGGASTISRALGKGDQDKAKYASSFAIYGCLITTFLYCLFALIFKDSFIDLIGGKDPSVHQEAVKYLIMSVVICGIPTSMNTLFAHLLRSQGKSIHASIGIALGGILNVALDPLFMFVILESGNEALGAAIATGLSNVIALIYYVVVLIVKRNQLIISAKPTKQCFKNKIPMSVISIGLPACIMTLCENISYAILDSLMAGVSLAAQTGVGVAKKVNMFAHSVVRGMAQGVLPLIGYTKANGNHKRMKSVLYISGLISLIIASISTVICLSLSNQLIEIFIHTGDDTLKYGSSFLKILCIGAPFSAIAYTVISFFQAVGKAMKSLILALLRKGIMDIPLMFILNNFISDGKGIVWATPISDIICSIVSIILFVLYVKKHATSTIESNNKEEVKDHVKAY